MKDLYIWFLVLFILVCSCIVCYRTGYDSGFKLGSSMCPAIQAPTGK